MIRTRNRQFAGPALFTVVMLLLTTGVSAQHTGKVIRQGNKLYEKEEYSSAETKYNKVLEADPTSQKGLFNQGGAFYQQEKYEEALQNFEITAEMMDDPQQRAAAYHNLGNTYFRSQQLEKSIEAYKNALRLHPSDEETRYNLALAQSMLQQQQQNQDQQDQENEDQQDQQDQQNKDQQDQEKGEDQQDQQQQQEQEKDGDQEQQQPEQGEDGEQQQQAAPQPSKLSKEEAQRILEALANDENKVQGKVIKAKTRSDNTKIEKDW